jgi:hypothetical protein
MQSGLILRHTQPAARGKPRPLPVGIGLTIGAATSLGLWAMAIRAMIDLLH